MTPTQITTTLAAHARWIAGSADGARANLRSADLRDADLRDADLRDAILSGADLRSAILRGADLSGADLSGTCLDPAAPVPAIDDATMLAAGLRVDGDYVYGYRTARSQHCGSTTYTPRDEPYAAPWCSLDTSTPCHPGVYLAGLAWLRACGEYRDAPLVACRCLRSELVHAGDKFRARRIWVLDEAVPS